MPTFGWIREDALDAFYEGTAHIDSTGVPPHPIFRCPFCSDLLANRKLLRDHVSSMHHVERPAILIGGREPGRRAVLRTNITSRSIEVANTTSATIVRDGGAPQKIPVDKLVELLTGIRQGVVSLVLANASQAKAAPVVTSYEISFKIADLQELKDVETAFSDIIMTSMISRDAIGRFINDARCKGPGFEYATGLAEYSLGVLLKERPDTESLTTPFSRYREEYGSALLRLADFERPFARLVSDIIRFAMNDFSRTSASTGFWELDLANSLLSNPNSRMALPSDDPEATRRPICPVDHGTGQILDLAARMSKQLRWSPILDDDCRNIAGSELLDANDRQKALAIWALAAWKLNARDNAIEPLRQICATYPFSAWAETYLESATK
jgi:hypothetical protein